MKLVSRLLLWFLYILLCIKINCVLSVTRVKQKTASNSVFKINFDPPLDDNSPPNLFGAKYEFSLEGVVMECPEFLVHFSTFVELAEKYGLTLVCRRRFDSYFNTVRSCPNLKEYS